MDSLKPCEYIHLALVDWKQWHPLCTRNAKENPTRRSTDIFSLGGGAHPRRREAGGGERFVDGVPAQLVPRLRHLGHRRRHAHLHLGNGLESLTRACCRRLSQPLARIQTPFCSVRGEMNTTAPREMDVTLPGKWKSNSRGARLVH